MQPSKHTCPHGHSDTHEYQGRKVIYCKQCDKEWSIVELKEEKRDDEDSDFEGGWRGALL